MSSSLSARSANASRAPSASGCSRRLASAVFSAHAGVSGRTAYQPASSSSQPNVSISQIRSSWACLMANRKSMAIEAIEASAVAVSATPSFESDAHEESNRRANGSAHSSASKASMVVICL